jgi:hypothetical protein
MSGDENQSAFFSAKPAETAMGVVVLTPDGPHPYKVVFRLRHHTLSEHPVATVREGEAMIRRELAHIQFTTREERPDPTAPKRRRKLSAVE